MPSVIPWDQNELQTLVSDPESRIFLYQKSISVVLQPFHLQDVKSAVRDLLNAGIDSYDKSLNGILLSYKHLKVTNKLASVAAETSGIVLDVQAEFFVFRPVVGCLLKGVVNKISKDHVGVLLYQRFNVTCPRPSSDARSDKWLGNEVVMYQEVTFKLKDQNLSGTLPFFKGKLLGKGAVTAPNIDEGEKKLKKKKKETKADISNIPDTSSATDMLSKLASPKAKNRKHKLEKPVEDADVKLKKSKKEMKDSVAIKSGSVRERSTEGEQASVKLSSPKMKKKKVSIGCDLVDFIPRLSLDVSQLPEDLPPPNADSTHFDLAKNMFSLNSKSHKKKNKAIQPELGSIREASSEEMKGSSITDGLINVTAKSQQSNEEKVKKKKEKKLKKEPSQVMTSLPEMKSKIKSALSDGSRKMQGISTHQLGLSTKFTTQVDSNPEATRNSSKKKNLTQVAGETSLKDEQSVSSKFSHVEDVLSNSLKKKKKQMQEQETVPIKEKTSKKAKYQDLSYIDGSKNSDGLSAVARSLLEDMKEKISSPKSKKKLKVKSQDIVDQLKPIGQEKKSGTAAAAQNLSNNIQEFQSPSKVKKKLKEESRNPTPSKQSKSKKDKETADVLTNDSIESDDTIPPGQRLVRESPVKQHSPNASLSMSYFAPPSSMLDMDLGSSKRPMLTPLMIGKLSDLILPPPESPTKFSPAKKSTKYKSDSDSDTPPKKVIVTSSLQKVSSDSESDREQPAVKSTSQFKNQVRKRLQDSSDDSEYDRAVQSKLLRWGVVQSPLMKAKPNLKQDSSDSESDGSLDMKGNGPPPSKLSSSKSISQQNVNTKSKKPMLASKVKSSLKKSSVVQDAPSSAKLPQSRRKDKSLSALKTEEASDSDEMENIKSILLKFEQEKVLGLNSKEKASKPITNKQKTPRNTPVKTPSKDDQAALNKFSLQKIPGKNLLDSVKNEHSSLANLSNITEDSDSGPDDKNTTITLEQMRLKLSDEVKAKKTKPSGKQTKSPKVPTSASTGKEIKETRARENQKEGSRKNKTTKGNDRSQVGVGKDTTSDKNGKKPKPKGKKKLSADEDISDVMQRLIREAKLNVGLS